MFSRTNTSSASKQNNGNSNGCYTWEKKHPVPRLMFHSRLGWSDFRTNIHWRIFQCFHSAALPQGKKKGGGRWGRLLPTSSPTPTFCKMPILRPQCTRQSAHLTTVAMAATIPNFLFVIKYSYRIALNFKIRLDTAPKRSPSQLLDISYYRNQSLGTGAHSRRSCRFQFYIVINAAGEENFTTIAGVDRTNPDLFYPVPPPRCRWTCSPPLPRMQLPLPLVLKWFPQSLCWGGCCKRCSIFQWLH